MKCIKKTTDCTRNCRTCTHDLYRRSRKGGPRGENSTRLEAQAVFEGHTKRAHSEPNEQQSDERKQSMQKGSHLKRGLLPLAQRFLLFFEKHISVLVWCLRLKMYAHSKILCKLVLQNRAPRQGGEHNFQKNDKKLQKSSV